VNERLRQINQSLSALDEAHRLGRISREDYRTRRRHLLGTLCDSGGITARNAVAANAGPDRRVAVAPNSNGNEAMSDLFPKRGLLDWRRWFRSR
jgi:hypothetical protein